jgi:hypothetical protein
MGIGDLVGGHHPRADAARVVEVLARGDLLGVELPVPHAALVDDGVAGDVAQGVGLGDVATALADDDAQLALIVELLGHGGRLQRRVVAGEGVDPAREQGRLLGQLLHPPGADHLGVVFDIVERQAPQMVRIGDRRQPDDGVERQRRDARAASTTSAGKPAAMTDFRSG